MTIQPRDVLTAFKPKLVEPPKRSDRQWATAVATMREAISEVQNLAMETAHHHPERFAEVSTILTSSEIETQLFKTATLTGGGDALHEMHRKDENYKPYDLPPECEFASTP